jgi:protease I
MARVVMPLAGDFEDSEFRKPYDSLRANGHDVVIVGAEAGKRVRGKGRREEATIDVRADGVLAGSFDAMVIPGGYSPDQLRINPAVVALVRDFSKLGRPLAAVCHGPQLLIEAGVVQDRTVTSWPSVKTDLQNAGANWVDEEVCEDGELITSRKPDDLDAFCRALLHRLSLGTTQDHDHDSVRHATTG